MEMGEIVIQNINQVYHNENLGDFNALSDINLRLRKGENLAVEGESGSGKSTLARLLIGLEKPTSGKILLDGEDITCWNYRTWKQHRKKIQAVFQDSSGTLNPARSAYANVEEALVNLTDKKKPERKKHILDLMDAVHMDYRLLETPVRQLSGGEQQRVSIARALAKNPKLLLCDEPTGALDYNTGKNILRLLQDTCRRDGVTVIVITHNSAIAPMADRVITVKNSKVDKVEINKDPVDVSTIEW